MSKQQIYELLDKYRQKQEQAKIYASKAKYAGASSEEVAWNHSYLAYEDIIADLKGLL